jgi:CubicO group peptidase (beta-lactamase class C family)
MTSSTDLIETLAPEAIRSKKAAGLAVGIVRRDQIIYTKGFGVRSLDTGEPVTERSLFHTASVSKTFVATAMIQLTEQGKIDLDQPLVRYLPYFKLDDARYDQITLRQMLTHTSGMPDTNEFDWHKPKYEDDALENYVRSLAHYKLKTSPGEQYAYSNDAYEILGDVIAKVSGETFEGYIKQHILNPIGMRDSTFLRAEVNLALATVAHTGINPDYSGPEAKVSPIYPYNREHAPSSTLHSSAVEMCRWALANLRRGKLDGARILHANSYYALWHPAAKVSPSEYRGLGWVLEMHKGQTCISHDGGDDGFGAMLRLFPQIASAVVVLSNNDWALFDITPITDAACEVACEGTQ